MRTFLRLFRRPSWVAFTIFVAFASVGFYELGVWQLHRHTHQNIVDAQLSRSKSIAPVPVASLLTTSGGPDTEIQWRRVTATGTYDASHELLVRNRVMEQSNGYEVVVPLRTTSGVDLLVDRGWIPSGPTALGPSQIPSVPSGTVTIMGRIRPPEAARNDAGLPAGQVQRIVPAQVATLTGRPTYGGFVDLVTESPSSADAPRILLTPDQLLSEDWWKPPHLAYAVQWFIFVLIACGGWVILGRREILNERELARADNSKVPQEH